jgi:GWxTD domain-containing protein
MPASKNNRKPLLAVLLAILLPNFFLGQIDAYFDSNVFNTPQNQPFLETHLTIVGKSLGVKENEGFFQNSVNITLVIYSDTSQIPVKVNKYNLHSPAFLTATIAPIFIDNQRYSLPNGIYKLELTLADNYNINLKPLVIKQTIKIKFDDKTIQCSDIQALESFKKASATTPLTKSGYDLVPYTVNYYPETSNQLAFYMETYNNDKILGVNKPMVYHYYIESADKLKPLSNYGSFKKQLSSAINPLLAKMDITTLGTGNYNLVVELIDSTNVIHVQQRYFFQRLNRNVDVVALQVYSENKNIAEYFGACNDADTLKMFVECLWPIAGAVDKDRIINQAIKKDPAMMKNFVIDFWQRRAADTANPLKMWAAYYQQVQKVMALFKCGKQKGYYSDRGRVFLQYGPPSQRAIQLVENNTFPYEIWQYYSTVDAVSGFTSSNRKFVFVNKMLGDDCFMLVHSDMRGEINNPRWQFELTRRNYNGIDNPDNTKPAGTELNQFDDLYSNPR